MKNNLLKVSMQRNVFLSSSAYTTTMVAEGVQSLEVELFILGPEKQFGTHLT